MTKIRINRNDEIFLLKNNNGCDYTAWSLVTENRVDYFATGYRGRGILLLYVATTVLVFVVGSSGCDRTQYSLRLRTFTEQPTFPVFKPLL